MTEQARELRAAIEPAAGSGAPAQERVLIVDFGSQVTQLIARRVREAGVYSEIVPFDRAEAGARAGRAQSHHPLRRAGLSVHERGHAARAASVFTAGVPVLGICYGEQAMVAASRRPGRGRA